MANTRLWENASEDLLPRIGPVAVATMMSALIAIHYLYLMMSPHEVLVCFIPDDAFYELQIARHHIATGMWSFDRGFSTTTGFHLLNVYLMSVFPSILTDTWFGLRFWMGMGLGLSIVAVFILVRFVESVFGPLSLVATGLILTAPSFSVLSGGTLEYPYVILIAALYVATLFRGPEQNGSFHCLGIFCLGFVGSLARSDFGGLPLAIVLACSMGVFTNGRPDYLKQSVWGLIGATAGLGLVFLHNYLLAGHFLSGSSLAKALWGTRAGYSLVSPVFIALETLVNSAFELTILVGLFLVVAVIRFWTLSRINRAVRQPPNISWEQSLLGRSGLIALFLYLLTYGADPCSQVWYTANFVIPFSLVLGTYMQWVSKGLAATVLAIGAFVLVMIPNIFSSYKDPWPNQSQMLQMADHLNRYATKGRVAGWNVGIIGYLLDGKVTNLDGLMNDQIYPYMKDNNVLQYITDARIEYLVDFPFQIDDLRLSRMCGYDARLRKNLHPVYTAFGEDRGGPWVNYTLYKLDRNIMK